MDCRLLPPWPHCDPHRTPLHTQERLLAAKGLGEQDEEETEGVRWYHWDGKLPIISPHNARYQRWYGSGAGGARPPLAVPLVPLAGLTRVPAAASRWYYTTALALFMAVVDPIQIAYATPDGL